MQRYRLLLTVFLAAILLGKAVVGAAFPLLGAAGHHESVGVFDCAPAVPATAQQPADMDDAPAAANVDPHRLRLHAAHDHSCPQLCMSAIDARGKCLMASIASTAPIEIAPTRQATRLVRPPLHPPRAGLGA
jgi:hypothetical protein